MRIKYMPAEIHEMYGALVLISLLLVALLSPLS